MSQSVFTLHLLTGSELSSDPDLCRHLSLLINEAYDEFDQAAFAGLFTTRRLLDDQQVSQELADTGIIAFLTDHSEAALQTYGGIVACGALKSWKGNSIETWRRTQNLTVVSEHSIEDGDVSPTDDYEVTLCASVPDPRYRSMGLVTRCLDACTQRVTEVRARRHRPLKLWMSVMGGAGKIEYWTRRGFRPEGTMQVAPKGVWDSTGEFELMTMSRVVS